MSAETLRIDKWLWFARFAKTRTAAQELCEAGHVAVNGEKVLKVSREVRIGDELDVLRGHVRFRIRIAAMIDKRVGAAAAQTLYEHLAAPENLKPPRERVFEVRPSGSGRPTKKDRRALNRLKGKF